MPADQLIPNSIEFWEKVVYPEVVTRRKNDLLEYRHVINDSEYFWENPEQSGLSKGEYGKALRWWQDQGVNRDYVAGVRWAWGLSPMVRLMNTDVWPAEHPWHGEPLWFIENNKIHYTRVPGTIKDLIEAELTEDDAAYYKENPGPFYRTREYEIIVAAWNAAHPSGARLQRSKFSKNRISKFGEQLASCFRFLRVRNFQNFLNIIPITRNDPELRDFIYQPLMCSALILGGIFAILFFCFFSNNKPYLAFFFGSAVALIGAILFLFAWKESIENLNPVFVGELTLNSIPPCRGMNDALKEAAGGGDANPQWELAQACRTAIAGESGIYQLLLRRAAETWVQRAADGGQEAAILALNPLKRLRKAADEGDHEAQWDLGIRLLQNQGIPAFERSQEAAYWLRRAVKPITAEEVEELVRRFSEKNRADVRSVFSRDAAPEKLLALGSMLQDGTFTPETPQEATDYLKRAAARFREHAEREECNSQLQLARMLRDGMGVEKNVAEAITWFRKAALRDERDAVSRKNARLELAAVLSEGNGVPADHREAAQWLWREGMKRQAIREFCKSYFS